MDLKTFWQLLQATHSEWNEDKAPRLAAALAFFTTLSLAPMLVVIITGAALVYGRSAAEGQVLAQVGALIGAPAADTLRSAIAATRLGQGSVLATAAGIVTLLIAATGVFAALQDALNTIWEVQPRPGLGIMEQVKARFLSFLLVLGMSMLLVASAMISTAITAVTRGLGASILPGLEVYLLRGTDFVLSLLISTLVFAAIYKVLPDVKNTWRDVWIGAFVTAILFVLGKSLLALYIGIAGVGSAYGAASALVVILIWTYYQAQALFLGAEFAQVYARRYGSQGAPTENAVALTEKARAEQGMPHEHAVRRAVLINDVLRPAPRARPKRTGRPRGQGRPGWRYATAAGGFVAGILVGVLAWSRVSK